MATRPSTSPSASMTCQARWISLALGEYVGTCAASARVVMGWVNCIRPPMRGARSDLPRYGQAAATANQASGSAWRLRNVTSLSTPPRRGTAPAEAPAARRHGGHRPAARPSGAPASCAPRPISTRVPTRLRTIWWQNAFGLDLEPQHTVAEVVPLGPPHAPHERRRRLVGAALRGRGRTRRSRARRRSGRRRGGAAAGRAVAPRATRWRPGRDRAPPGSAPCSGRCGTGPRTARRSRPPRATPPAPRSTDRTAS